jgi:transcriptional regulator with XRE-family HTH domain
MHRSSLPADASIGDRLRRLRKERGLTQEELAERAAVSVDLVKKLEQGRRQSARLTSLTSLATALGVPRSEMLDKRPRLGAGDDALVLGLRDAILSLDVLTGIDLRFDDGAATPVSELAAQVEQGWTDYWAGDFGALAATLPALIAEGRISQRTNRVGTSGPLAQSYQLASCLLVQLGREDLAAVGAERAIAAAANGDDELQWATLHGTCSWALLTQGRYDEAEQLAIRIAGRIEPRFSSDDFAHLAVWGGLVLWALAAAVEAGRSDPVGEYISLAKAGAARLAVDRHDYQVNYGPTQVAMQTTYAHAMLGQPDKALVAARDVRREDLQTISYGRHLLDVAQAHTEARHYEPAEDALKRAKDAAPVWFRHQPLARSVIADLGERRARLSPLLRELVGSLEAA